jgi:hypothetical protein
VPVPMMLRILKRPPTAGATIQPTDQAAARRWREPPPARRPHHMGGRNHGSARSVRPGMGMVTRATITSTAASMRED